jgi:DNA-binding response OmpR family regulator
LKQLVRRLRQKIEADPAAPRYVLTSVGEGYRFEPRPG